MLQLFVASEVDRSAVCPGIDVIVELCKLIEQ